MLGVIGLCHSVAVAEASALTVDASGRQSLVGHLAVLEDPESRWSVEQVLRGDAPFQAVNSSVLAFGFHTGRIWVRLQLWNGLDVPTVRWLENSWPFKDFVDFYRQDPNGVVTHWVSGAAVPLADRPLQSRNLIFPVALQAGERTALYLAFSGLAATTVGLTLWTPEAFADYKQFNAAVRFFALGSVLIILVFGAIAANALRDGRLILAGVGDLLVVALLFGLDGFFFDFLPLNEALYPSRFALILMGLALCCHFQFLRAFLRSAQHSWWLDQGIQALAYFFLVMCWLAAINRWNFLFPLVGGLPFLLLFLLALHGVRYGGERAGLYLASWGPLWLVVFLRTLQQGGWIQLGLDLNMLPTLAMPISAMVLSYALYREVRLIQLAMNSAESALEQQREGELNRLQQAVNEKTAALQEALGRAEKSSEAKSAFLSMMSHELRAPLHTILGYAELLQRDARGGDRAKLDTILGSGRQLLRLIDEVLEFSRGDMGEIRLSPHPVPIRELGQQLVSANQIQAARQGNQITLDIDDTVPAWVVLDEQRIKQVLQNLVGNAIKFTVNGRIRLEIKRLVEEEIPGEDAAVRLQFTVSDTGFGIPKADQVAVFEPFQRLERDRHKPGVGLGLAIVNQLVSAMGGRVVIESQTGPAADHGTTVRFALTVQSSSGDAPMSPTLPDITGYRGMLRTLLVVDDNPDNRRYLKERCERWGFIVELADDGESALACLRQIPGISMVLVDQFMPGMDGWDFLYRCRLDAEVPRIPVVLVSAAEPRRPPHLPALLKFDAVLLKPLDPALLMTVLQEKLFLTWTFREAPLPAILPAAAQLTLDGLSPGDIEQFRAMVDKGQILAIRKWLPAVKTRYPQHQTLLLRIGELCERVDLPGLAAIANTAGTDSGDSHA